MMPGVIIIVLLLGALFVFNWDKIFPPEKPKRKKRKS